jgi:hypothetical protein
LWGDFREKLKISELHKKVIWSRRLTPAVNENGEFAGNVQFVADVTINVPPLFIFFLLTRLQSTVPLDPAKSVASLSSSRVHIMVETEIKE